jgi:hypothetical protein
VHGIGQTAESQREIGLVFGHAAQQILRQRHVVRLRLSQAELAAQAVPIGCLEGRREAV